MYFLDVLLRLHLILLEILDLRLSPLFDLIILLIKLLSYFAKFLLRLPLRILVHVIFLFFGVLYDLVGLSFTLK